jgi:hypothetical protein
VIKRNAQKKWRTSDKNISFISYRQKQLWRYEEDHIY